MLEAQGHLKGGDNVERFYIREADCGQINAQILRAHQVESMGIAQRACYVYMGEFESVQQARRQHVRELSKDAAKIEAEKAWRASGEVYRVHY